MAKKFNFQIKDNMHSIDIINHNNAIIINAISDIIDERIDKITDGGKEEEIEVVSRTESSFMGDFYTDRIRVKPLLRMYDTYLKCYKNMSVDKNTFYITSRLLENVQLLNDNLEFTEIPESYLIYLVLLNGLPEPISDIVEDSEKVYADAVERITCQPSRLFYIYLEETYKSAIANLLPCKYTDRFSLFITKVFHSYMFEKAISQTDLDFYDIDTLNTFKHTDFNDISEDIVDIVNLILCRNNTNVFMYGAVGLGKTEISKTISRMCDKKLVKINLSNYVDLDKKPNILNLVKRIVSNYDSRETIILFDEAHEYFSEDELGLKTTDIHELLDINIPKIFISNYTMFKSSYKRRFDYILEISQKQQRANITKLLKDYFEDMLPDNILDKIVKHKNINIAVVHKCLNFFDTKGDYTYKDIVKYFNSYLKLIVAEKISDKLEDNKKKKEDSLYHLEYINTKTDLKSIIDTLDKQEGNEKTARLLFYGEPGTGKSEFGKELAKELGMKADIIYSSDILSKFVGETEGNIKNIFKKAKEKNRVLIIDEIDSLIFDRRGAHTNHEVSAVNEILKRMENFDGIFIGTTNNLDQLDKASIRRFDMVIEFKHVNKEKIVDVFKTYSTKAGIKHKKIPVEVIHRLKQLSNVSLGDFGAALRRSKFSPIKTHKEFLKVLEEMVEVKTKNSYSSKTMGFVS